MGLLMDEMEWGQRVVRLRHKMGWTQDRLRDELGVGNSTVPLWECRKERPYSKAAEAFMALEAELEEASAGEPS